MERILVGVDDSQSPRVALSWAADLSRRANLELHAATVVEGRRLARTPEGDIERRREHIHRLEVCSAELPADVPRPKEHLLEGDPATVLLDAATQLGADLLVVGGRGEGGFLDLVLGSVAHHLMRRTTLPLAVVPAGADPSVTHVVLGVDGSPSSLRAVGFGAELAATAGLGATAVHAFEPFLEWVPENDPEGWHRRAEEELRAWVAPVEEAGVSLELDVDRDIHPVAAIRRALDARPGSVAVVGARGAGGFRELLLGGVPMQLVHHTGAPVVVVPRKG